MASSPGARARPSSMDEAIITPPEALPVMTSQAPAARTRDCRAMRMNRVMPP